MPTVSIDSPLEQFHVFLLGAKAPEFVEKLPAVRDRATELVIPYAALLKNESSQSIVAYTVIWTLTDIHGKNQVSEDAWFNFSQFPSPRHIPPHVSKFVTLFGTDSFDGSGLGMVSVGSDMLQLFQHQQSIQIQLSSVLFSDGTAVGPDTSGWVLRWKALLAAEEISWVGLSGAPGQLRATLEPITLEASDSAAELLGKSPGSLLSFGDFFQAYKLSDNFEQARRFARCFIAARILEGARNIGEDRAVENLKKRVSMVYPVVHSLKQP